MSRRKKTKSLSLIEYLLFQGLFLIIRLVPLSWGVRIGENIGRLAFFLLRGRRKMTIDNIKEAKEKGYLKNIADPTRLARQVWQSFGVTAGEFLYYYSHQPQQLLDHVTLEGAENLHAVLAQKKGAVLVMAHVGNWELLGMYLSLAGYHLSPLVKTQSNPFFDKIIQGKRESVGMKVIPRSKFLRPVVNAFKRNEIVPFLIDQADPSNGVLTEFFGKDSPIPRGAAEFALKTATPVIFGYIARQADFRHRIVISPELALTKTNVYQNDLKEATAAFAGLLQKVIETYPDQWIWMHQFWR